MLKIERILCPVDFSEDSEKAYDYAYSLALQYRAKLFVEHIVPIFEYGNPFAAEAGLYFDLIASAKRDLGKLIGRHAANGLEIETDVQNGYVPDSILSAARRQHADLIVMGTHGRRGMDRLLMGSTTENVLRKASCPVLAVRKPAHDFVNPDQVEEPVRLQKVQLCTDFSDCAEAAKNYALSLAQEYNAELTLLHVVEGLPEQRSEVLLRVTRQKLEDLVPKDAGNWCNIKTVVRFGKSYEEIIQHAVEQQVDLAILGVRGRNLLDLAIFGSTTQRVLQLGPCPVLAVHMQAARKTASVQAAKPRAGRRSNLLIERYYCLNQVKQPLA
jgi:nucleotide-binding universal stress UspA family protein